MKRVVVGVMSFGLMIGAVACGSSVDKAGTANNLVKSLEQTIGTTMTSTQKSCLTTLVKSYSSADLKTIDSQSTSTTPNSLVDDFRTKVLTCIGLDASGGATTEAGTDSTVADTTPAT